jgi:type III pantothenate kinase
LAAGTSLLQNVQLEAPPKAICSTTTQSMQSGGIFGHAAMVDGMIDRFEQELGCTASVVATGGIAAKVIPHCKRSVAYDPDLLMKGLNTLYKKNKRPEN